MAFCTAMIMFVKIGTSLFWLGGSTLENLMSVEEAAKRLGGISDSNQPR
jgi:hypothetical protein